MNKQNCDSNNPWNPKSPVDITPQQFEQQVLQWIKVSLTSESDIQIIHQANISGQGGEYAIDIQAQLNLFKGAISYAKAHGIATITVINGNWLYETKSLDDMPTPPPWADLPEFAGIFISPIEDGLQCQTISPGYLDALKEFLIG